MAKTRFYKILRYFFLIYITGLCFFTFYRVILLLLNLNTAKEIPLDIIFQSFIMGFRFDTSILCYLLILPYLFGNFPFIGMEKGITRKIVTGFIILMFGICFFISCSDIPYYQFFRERLTPVVLHWKDTPGFMINVVLHDKTYYPYIFLFAFSFALTIFLLTKIEKKTRFESEWKFSFPSTLSQVILTVASLGIIFLGIRGRIEKKSAIRWGLAYFSPYPFANQLGLNSVFTTVQGALDQMDLRNKPIKYFDDEFAFSELRKELGIENPIKEISPIARKISFNEPPRKYNVVIILMESFASKRIGVFGAIPSLTPNFDSLSAQGIFFRNFYSAGIHTHNGEYGTLFGLPATLSKHPMATAEAMQEFCGLPNILSANGYETFYFTTHDEHFDNAGGFFAKNGIHYIISLKDFPKDEELSYMGVADGKLFGKAEDALKNSSQPFLAVIMTGTFHGPYLIPKKLYYTSKGKDDIERALEYSDWVMGKFIRDAKNFSWFDSTVFLILGDHGIMTDPVYDVDLSYQHIPLLMYAPKIFSPKIIDDFGSQIDIPSTVMDILKISYINNTMGINLFSQHRDKISFCKDDNIGVVTKQWFLVDRKNAELSLYDYKNNSLKNFCAKKKSLCDSLRAYGQRQVQCGDWLVRNRKVNCTKHNP